jgi:16S rRNA processing protein RimM
VDAAAVPSEGKLPEDAIEVGRVIGAWGIKGGIKIKPFAADPQALFSSKRWFIQPPEPSLSRPGPVGEIPSLLRVIGAKEHGDGVVATVQEVADRTAAEALKGARVFVSRASFPTPDADEFYWVDLIGLDAVARSGVLLGTVIGLIETGPHCVLRVQPASNAEGDAAEVLIPFVAAYVDKVDLQERRIVVDWEADY